MTRLEQVLLAGIHGFLWVVLRAAAEPKAADHNTFVIYTMGLILLYVLPGAALAWRIRAGLDSKEWTRITVRAWLTAAFVIAVLSRLGFTPFVQQEIRNTSSDMCIFAGLVMLPVLIAWVLWLTRASHKRASYPIRGARRKFGTKPSNSNSVPFSGEMGTRL